jgi:hypothetical protein
MAIEWTAGKHGSQWAAHDGWAMHAYPEGEVYMGRGDRPWVVGCTMEDVKLKCADLAAAKAAAEAYVTRGTRAQAIEAAVAKVAASLEAKQAEAERLCDNGGFGVHEEIDALRAALGLRA